jgi:hypothetical protein
VDEVVEGVMDEVVDNVVLGLLMPQMLSFRKLDNAELILECHLVMFLPENSIH